MLRGYSISLSDQVNVGSPAIALLMSLGHQSRSLRIAAIVSL
jgi:hypothetical protein